MNKAYMQPLLKAHQYFRSTRIRVMRTLSVCIMHYTRFSKLAAKELQYKFRSMACTLQYII